MPTAVTLLGNRKLKLCLLNQFRFTSCGGSCLLLSLKYVSAKPQLVCKCMRLFAKFLC